MRWDIVYCCGIYLNDLIYRFRHVKCPQGLQKLVYGRNNNSILTILSNLPLSKRRQKRLCLPPVQETMESRDLCARIFSSNCGKGVFVIFPLSQSMFIFPASNFFTTFYYLNKVVPEVERRKKKLKFCFIYMIYGILDKFLIRYQKLTNLRKFDISWKRKNSVIQKYKIYVLKRYSQEAVQ